MNPVILAGIMKNFYGAFSMENFSDRFKLQKVIYLLKSKNIKLGYSFNLYSYGPYSKGLTSDGFQMMDLVNFKEVSELAPKEMKAEFLSFVASLKEDDRYLDENWLEVIASYLYLKNNFPDIDEGEIIEVIMNKREDMPFSEKEVKDIIESEKGGYFLT